MEYDCFLEENNNVIKDFYQKNQDFVNQPIVKSFFSKHENRVLLKNALIENDQESRNKLDAKFHDHYQQARMTKYLSNLIYFNSINFDKSIRKQKETYLTILNQPLADNTAESNGDEFVDVLASDAAEIFEEVVSYSAKLEDHIQDEELFYALQELSPMQKEILQLIYVDQLKNKEIALLKNTSPQNISKIHKRAIEKIKNYYKGG
ncbi:sigma-70 family RNA polymerase sigma factor [Sediminibacillus albus]|uniref:RNA polymerase sigma factor, sigma-70 family n=1 Tax=Sediminibacillus albus TaxID=407036 RepID=A0A1G9AII7_9BACI|nr:sigma-70 family RNA polymerase sigma factor [Sediminibacillus albus]SDK27169.1 RNA polymerase sigma factor, sigma-70 family [Sediminibacillus albus]